MRSTFILIFFIFLSISSFGQKIYFTDTTNTWRVFYSTCGLVPYSEGFSTYYYKGDTLLAGTVYQKVGQTYSGSQFFIREDTTQRKVYIRTYQHPGVDTNEMVLYDYNLQLGDTTRVNSVYIHATYRVESLDSTLIGNHYYKVWKMRNDSFGMPHPLGTPPNYAVYYYYVVEGIGSLTDPQYPIYPYFFEGCEWLTCFHNNGQTLPLSAKIEMFDNTASCTFMSVKETSLRNAASVYPNPANGTSVIELKQAITKGQLDVYDLLGRNVYHTTIDGETKIPIGKYPPAPGQYFFKVTDKSNGQIYTGKFLFE